MLLLLNGRKSLKSSANKQLLCSPRTGASYWTRFRKSCLQKSLKDLSLRGALPHLIHPLSVSQKTIISSTPVVFVTGGAVSIKDDFFLKASTCSAGTLISPSLVTKIIMSAASIQMGKRPRIVDAVIETLLLIVCTFWTSTYCCSCYVLRTCCRCTWAWLAMSYTTSRTFFSLLLRMKSSWEAPCCRNTCVRLISQFNKKPISPAQLELSSLFNLKKLLLVCLMVHQWWSVTLCCREHHPCTEAQPAHAAPQAETAALNSWNPF